MSSEFKIRRARLDDLEHLRALYNWFVVNSHVTFDLESASTEQRREWLLKFLEAPLPQHLLLVAVACDDDSRLLGYASSGQFRVKPAYDGSVELSVYVDPETQGKIRGIGTALYAELFSEIAKLPKGSVHRSYAVIAMPNDASVALHRKFGFREVGTLHEVGLKFGKRWSCLMMEKRHDEE